MKRHNSYFLLTHQICLLCFLYLYPFSMLAKPQHVFQSKDPIVNFAWDENDTSRYEGHYRYEQAYKMIEDMLSDVDNIRKWLSVDPLADKYPNISPYAYCNWNPIKYVDPDGREIINTVSPSDKTRYDAGNNIIDQKDNHIFFVSHGSPTAMYPHGQGEMNAEGFVNYLKENSKVWQKTEDKSSIVIVLIACETGKGDNPIAQQISKLLPEATIVAPTEEAKATEYGGRAYVTGVAKKDAATLGDAKKPENAGQWNAYRNGELIGHSANGNVNYIYKDNDF